MLSEKPWKLERVILFVALVLVGIGFGGMIAALLAHLQGLQQLDPNSNSGVLMMTFTAHGSILLGTAAVLWWYRIKWADAFGFSTPRRLRAVLMGIAAAALFLPVGILLMQASMWAIQSTGRIPSQQQAIASIESAHSWQAEVYLIGWSTIVAPIAEEILFRGVLYAGFKQMGFPRIALWGSALLFGLIHATGAIFVPLTVFALTLAWLYEKTDNLLAPIAAHSSFNAINLVFLYFESPLKQAVERGFGHH